MIKLYDYQTHIENELNKNNQTNCCVQLATGGGKTFTFAHYLIDQAEKTNTVRFMVCVHREELLEQTVESFRDLGHDPDVVCSDGTVLKLKPRKHGEVFRNSRFIVAMVETLASRIERGFSFPGIDTLVIDECHRGEFFKITGGWEVNKKDSKLEYIDGLLNHRRRIGFTATPWFMSKQRAMCLFYDQLILGADINELIDFGSLIKPNTYVADIDPRDFSGLEAANNAAGFSAVSLNGIFTKPEMIEQVFHEYISHGFGRQTLIFAVSVKHANALFKHFKEKNINVRVYHSKGDSIESRREIVQWFKNNGNAVLINVDVFTTGFDCKTVGCVILARSTRSLALFLQIVGRGGRAYVGNDYIKTDWAFVDLGFNIDGVPGVFHGHGGWEMPRAKFWNREFDNFRLDNEAMPTKSCPECEHENRISATNCEKCGAEFPKRTVDANELRRIGSREYNQAQTDEVMRNQIDLIIKKVVRSEQKPQRTIFLMIDQLLKNTIEKNGVTPEQWDENQNPMRKRIHFLFYKYAAQLIEDPRIEVTKQQIHGIYWLDQLNEKINVFWIQRKEKFKHLID
jgi:superfamily II DNA or RNA helicase